VVLNIRPLGSNQTFEELQFQLVNPSRQVYSNIVPRTFTLEDFEYYVVAELSAENIVWPLEAPDVCQTVVVS